MIEMSMPLSYHVCRAPAQRLLLAQLRQEARQRHPSDPANHFSFVAESLP